MESDQPRRLLAEALGTALLIFFGVGSVIAALTVGEGALDYAGLGMIALAFGLVVAIVIYAFGTTSGAHINPAVTLALAATGRFPWREVPTYVLARWLARSRAPRWSRAPTVPRRLTSVSARPPSPTTCRSSRP